MTGQTVTFTDPAGAIVGSHTATHPGWNRIPSAIAVKLLDPTFVQTPTFARSLNLGDHVMMFHVNDRTNQVEIKLFTADQARSQEIADAQKHRGFDSLVFRAATAVLGSEGRVVVHADLGEKST